MTSSWLPVLVLTAVALSLPAPLFAQEPVAEPPANLPVTVAPPAVILPGAAEAGPGAWRLRPDVTLKRDSPGASLEGIPRWHLGVRAERQLFSRVSAGGMATLSRGEDGPLVASSELGTGRGLSTVGSLTGPGTYRTVFNTALTVSVSVKATGRLRLDAIGEIWNPFFGDRCAGTGADVPLHGRAVKFGLRTTF